MAKKRQKPLSKEDKDSKAKLDGLSFAELISPIDEATFFNEYYDKKPLHIPANLEKAETFKRAMNWDVLNGVINMTNIWGHSGLALILDRHTVAPHYYCHEASDINGTTVQQPIPEKVIEVVKSGASLVLNNIDPLTAELNQIGAELEKAFDAKVNGNLYCSWKERQALDSHFDTHDVFAVHFLGKKRWKIYETLVPHAMRHPLFDQGDSVARAEKRGEVLMEIEMNPGDILYLPRGQYHDALAHDEAAIHIAFGIVGYTGLNLLDDMMHTMVREDIYRSNLPRITEGDAVFGQRIDDLIDSFSSVLKDGALRQQLKQKIMKFRTNRGQIQLGPQGVQIERERLDYIIAPGDFRVVKQGNSYGLVIGSQGIAIPNGFHDAVQYVIDRGGVNQENFFIARPWKDRAQMSDFIQNLVNMKMLKKA